MKAMSIKNIRQKHEAIIDYMIANPDAKQGKIAQEFGFTQSWLSIVMNSDAFKSRLAEKNEEVFREIVIPLREKLEGVAHRAVEKLGEKVNDSQDAKFLLEAADKTLHRLGYAPNKGPDPGQSNTTIQQNNFYTVDSEALKAARDKMDGIREVSGEVVEDDVIELPAPEGV